jgi:AbrB family looped-hinge helix DNA binding protein
MNSILSEKGQITIPKRLREDLGLVPGTVLDFSEEDGRLVAKRIGSDTPIKRWRGSGRLPQAKSVDAYIRKVRGA